MVDENSQDMQLALMGLLTLAGIPIEKPVIDGQDVMLAVASLRKQLQEARYPQFQAAAPISSSTPTYSEEPSQNQGNQGFVASRPKSSGAAHHILIAGELGIIIHQLKQSLSRLGYEIQISKDLYEAPQLYKTNQFDVVILDANTDESYEALVEIDTNARQRQLSGDIIVLIPPNRDNTFRQRYKDHGATVVLPKDEGWQTFILEYLRAIGG